jgi:hypothetical protein
MAAPAWRSLAPSLSLAAALLVPACGDRGPRPPGPPVPTDGGGAGVAAPLPEWAAGACVGDGWCWAHPRPTGVKLKRLWGAGPRDVWAVGDAGTILRFDGARWAEVASGTRHDLVAISGRAPGDAWAIGRHRTVLRLRGAAWTPLVPAVDASGRYRWLDLPLPGDRPDAARSVPRAFTHEDWPYERARAAAPPEEGELEDLTVLPNGEAWLVGGITKRSVVGEDISSTCIVGHYQGSYWLFDQDENDCGPLRQVWAAGPSDVWARGGDVVHWNGRYLTRNPAGKPAPMVGRHGHAGGWRMEKPVVEGADGVLSHATYSPADKSPLRVTDFWAFGPEDVWAIDGDGRLARFDGRSWTRGDAPVRITAVAARGPDDVWAVATPAALLHFDGRSWQAWPIRAAVTESPVAIAAPAPNDVWVATSSRILRFDGRSWRDVPLPLMVRLLSLLARGPDDVWIGGDHQVLHWNGKALAAHAVDFLASALSGEGRELWAGPPIHRWDGARFVAPPELGGDANKHLARAPAAFGGGALWLAHSGRILRLASGHLETVKEVRASLGAIWVSPAGDVWAAGSHIVHGRGTTWTVTEAPAIGRVFAIGGAPGLVWVGGENGVLFRTDR